jgi:hypothetical protein
MMLISKSYITKGLMKKFPWIKSFSLERPGLPILTAEEV